MFVLFAVLRTRGLSTTACIRHENPLVSTCAYVIYLVRPHSRVGSPKTTRASSADPAPKRTHREAADTPCEESRRSG